MIDKILFYTLLVTMMCWVGSYLALAMYAWRHTKGVPLAKRLINASGFPGLVVHDYRHNLRLARGDIQTAAKNTLEDMPRLAGPTSLGEPDP